MSNIDHIEEAKIQKLNEIKAAGIEPYGYRFDAQFMVEQVHEQFELEKEVSVAGRVMAFRAHGKNYIYGRKRFNWQDTALHWSKSCWRRSF